MEGGVPGSMQGGGVPASMSGGGGGGGPPAQAYGGGGGGTYESIVAQCGPTATTIYVGNLPPFVTQQDLIPLFQGYGYIVEIRMQADRGFAFVKMDTHENAAMAIVSLQGTNVQGRTMKCSWGKDRNDGPVGATSAPPQQQLQQQQYQQVSYTCILCLLAACSLTGFLFPFSSMLLSLRLNNRLPKILLPSWPRNSGRRSTGLSGPPMSNNSR